MAVITANELKTKGVSVLDASIKKDGEAMITVRGKEKYVVLSMETYNTLREFELEAALNEVKQDIVEGNFVTESVDDHIERITK